MGLSRPGEKRVAPRACPILILVLIRCNMNDDTRPLRPHGNEFTTSEYVQTLLQILEGLAKNSDPAGGDESAKGKDGDAFHALLIAGDLVKVVAGWAINHQVGLALQGLEFVPLGPAQLRTSAEYVAARAEVDQHAHEINGREARHDDPPLPDFVVRQALINLLRPNTGALPSGVYKPALHALEAIGHGERHPIFDPPAKNGKLSLRARQLQLRALGFVAFMRATTMSKGEAEIAVLEAYGLSGDSIDAWVRQARNWFGKLHVEQEIGFAENCASHVNAHAKALRAGQEGDPDLLAAHMRRYGPKALAAAGQEFQRVRTKGAS